MQSTLQWIYFSAEGLHTGSCSSHPFPLTRICMFRTYPEWSRGGKTKSEFFKNQRPGTLGKEFFFPCFVALEDLPMESIFPAGKLQLVKFSCRKAAVWPWSPGWKSMVTAEHKEGLRSQNSVLTSPPQWIAIWKVPDPQN